jgi:hypothetical protein
MKTLIVALIAVILFQGWSIRRLIPLAGYVNFRYFIKGQLNLCLQKLPFNRQPRGRAPLGQKLTPPAACDLCYCVGCKNDCTTCQGCNDLAARRCLLEDKTK